MSAADRVTRDEALAMLATTGHARRVCLRELQECVRVRLADAATGRAVKAVAAALFNAPSDDEAFLTDGMVRETIQAAMILG
jgi:hypothetical protein